MRFGLNARSVGSVEEVSSGLITTRKVIFVPSADIKQELKDTSISITCYDRNGKVVKTVTSADPGEVEEDNTNTNTDNTEQGGGSNTEQGGSSTEQGGGNASGDDGMGD